MTVALVALFVALGGVGYAAVTINGKNIKDKTVTGAKLKNNTLSGTQIRESALKRVPRAQRADIAGRSDETVFLRRQLEENDSEVTLFTIEGVGTARASCGDNASEVVVLFLNTTASDQDVTIRNKTALQDVYQAAPLGAQTGYQSADFEGLTLHVHGSDGVASSPRLFDLRVTGWTDEEGEGCFYNVTGLSQVPLT